MRMQTKLVIAVKSILMLMIAIGDFVTISPSSLSRTLVKYAHHRRDAIICGQLYDVQNGGHYSVW